MIIKSSEDYNKYKEGLKQDLCVSDNVPYIEFEIDDPIEYPLIVKEVYETVCKTYFFSEGDVEIEDEKRIEEFENMDTPDLDKIGISESIRFVSVVKPIIFYKSELEELLNY